MKCPGIEIEPGIYSGCGGGKDCPTCNGKEIIILPRSTIREAVDKLNPCSSCVCSHSSKLDNISCTGDACLRYKKWLELKKALEVSE